MNTTKAQATQTQPTGIDGREEILIVITADGESLPLTRVEYWTENETTFLRGLEFDLLVEGDDLSDAVQKCGIKVYERLEEMLALADQGNATAEEHDVLDRLEERVLRIHLAQRRDSQRSNAGKKKNPIESRFSRLQRA
ncbi:MAG: hypothetical protein JJE13_08905 [Thermoleophilia bacterium]|nr:hypothetical protein [Thermoleophilia bacterium]